MEEIVNINGIPYRISASNVSPQQWSEIKAEQIRKLQSECTTCGKPVSLALPTCPASIVQGTIKPVNVTITGGTSPFQYRWLVDAVEKIAWSAAPGVSFSFNWTFSETVASHIYRLEVRDSCVPTPLTDFSECTISITAVCPSVSCAFTIPA